MQQSIIRTYCGIWKWGGSVSKNLSGIHLVMGQQDKLEGPPSE